MSDLPTQLEDLVKNAMKENLSGSSGIYPFLDPDDYFKKTGRRFRITREQKKAGISRQEAFEQFMQKKADKV